ncbi:MAG: thiamine pyrophosphate-binding protein [Nitrospiraceae bacterium]|nr:thiamine pyrophosphate-binding protein [Nitrospiraceae bacterium]
MDIKVGSFIVRYLERLGVEYVFGIPGAHILPVYNALYDSPIKSVLTKHEQGASFMAGGYAKQSGKVGVCIATAGPGATNLVTGLANAYMDHLPVLAITGETPTYSFGKGALQESSGEGACIDQFDIFRGITRYNNIVQRTDYILNVLRTVTGILTSKNPGPVLLSFPYNILKETVDEGLLDQIHFDDGRLNTGEDTIPAGEILSLIRGATHPVILAGYGSILSHAEDAVARFCAKTGTPVATSLKARGIVPESSELSLGVLGITSNEAAFRYISEKADLVIIAGASFGERTSYNWNRKLLEGKKIVQIDTDEAQLNKVFTADFAVQGDVKRFFEIMNKMLDESPAGRKETKEAAEFKSRYHNHDIKDNEFLLVSRFLSNLNRHADGEALIFDDNIIYMQRFFTITGSGSYFPNSGISSLGHAIPAAIGARFASGRPVIALLGDGGFQMCCMEIMTAVNYGIPLTVVLLNNSSLGLVRKNQFYNYGGRFIASEFVNPDYRKLADSFGIEYFRVETESGADELFGKLDFRNRTNLIELILNKNEFPTYSSGR